jgi:hypothetical protein
LPGILVAIFVVTEAIAARNNRAILHGTRNKFFEVTGR